MKFTRTIRFRLTLWYSLLLLFFCMLFIAGINLLITSHYKRNINSPSTPRWIRNNLSLKEEIQELDIDKRELLEKYRNQDLITFRQLSLLSLAPLSIVSFAGGYLISGQMLSPLKNLNRKISQINAKNLKSKLEFEETGDEIGELIKNFNNMISRLNISFEAQKQFVENASHELKTPLAIIQTNLDAATLDNKITKREMQTLIRVSQKASNFMNKLIEDLLLLSILENRIQKEQVDLKEIFKSTVNNLQPLADKKNIDIISKIQSGNYQIEGSQALLQRALMNIVENSIKYSAKRSKIRLELMRNNSSFLITVKDRGEGISGTEQEKVFDRFYRVHKSRSRETGGAGLGLSIAKKVVGLHNGKIQLRSKLGKGTTVEINLPKE